MPERNVARVLPALSDEELKRMEAEQEFHNSIYEDDLMWHHQSSVREPDESWESSPALASPDDQMEKRVQKLSGFREIPEEDRMMPLQPNPNWVTKDEFHNANYDVEKEYARVDDLSRDKVLKALLSSYELETM